MFDSHLFDNSAKKLLTALSIAAVLATVGCDASINKSIRVDDGESVSGSLTSVNGSITVGSQAKVKGNAQTVNGSIRVGDGTAIGDVSTVNGSIRVNDQVQVSGSLESVNGAIETGAGTSVGGDVQTINGQVRLKGTAVDGGIETHNGSIILSEGSRVSRSVRIKGEQKLGSTSTIEVQLTGGSVIEGDLIVDDEDQKVRVTVDATSEVKGEIRGAELSRI
ncbi:MAG: hypothetical protein AAGM22_27015 [Acidobacteriota bacterium]